MVLIWKGSVVAVYPTKTHRWKRDNGTKTRHNEHGTLRAILDQADISKEQFLSEL